MLASSGVISFAGLLALAGAAQFDRNPRSRVGILTLLLSTAAATLTLWMIWTNPSQPIWGQVFVCL